MKNVLVETIDITTCKLISLDDIFSLSKTICNLPIICSIEKELYL